MPGSSNSASSTTEMDVAAVKDKIENIEQSLALVRKQLGTMYDRPMAYVLLRTLRDATSEIVKELAPRNQPPRGEEQIPL